MKSNSLATCLSCIQVCGHRIFVEFVLKTYETFCETFFFFLILFKVCNNLIQTNKFGLVKESCRLISTSRYFLNLPSHCNL